MFAWRQRSSTTISTASKLSPSACWIPAAAAGRWQGSPTRARGQRSATRMGLRRGATQTTQSRWE
eukprot:1823350-Alexandrium_andersonii.AAC.1